jgi:cephalosporin-C deacetylase
MLYDLPLDQLRTYLPERAEPADFTEFWQTTLDDARSYPLDATFTPVDCGLKLIETYDVTFRGYNGQPIKGWFFVPGGHTEPLPCIVEYIGYGGGRGLPIEWLFWSNVGYAHFVMDTRGQGSFWRSGDTPDHEPEGSNPQHPGFMTRGILNPRTYYYRRVYTDGVRAVEAARSHPMVDPNRIILTGGSQGGGIALAVSGLVPDVAATMPNVPFLSHIKVATEIIDSDPYGEIVRYCRIHRNQVDTVYQTIEYFDGMHFAARAQAPALFSVALMDDTCPPRTVFASFNHYGGSKEIKVWPYNRHEGGQADQDQVQLRWLQEQNLVGL